MTDISFHTGFYSGKKKQLKLENNLHSVRHNLLICSNVLKLIIQLALVCLSNIKQQKGTEKNDLNSQL